MTIRAIWILGVLLGTGCCPKPALRLPALPNLGASPRGEPPLPNFDMPPPEIRLPRNLPKADLGGRTLGLAVRTIADALAGGLARAAPLSDAGSELVWVLVEKGTSHIVPLYSLAGVQAEIKGTDQTRIWGDINQVAALGRSTRADTLVALDLDVGPLTSLFVEDAERAKYEIAYASYREGFDAAARRAREAIRSFEEAYGRAEQTYTKKGGRFVDDEDEPGARGSTGRTQYRTALEESRNRVSELETALAKLPPAGRKRLEDAVKSKSVGGSYGVLASARVLVLDLATSQVLVLARVKVAARTPEETMLLLAKVVGESVL